MKYLVVNTGGQVFEVERCRAGDAGIPAFYSPTSVGTDLAKGKEIREFNGKPHVLEHAIHVDYGSVTW